MSRYFLTYCSKTMLYKDMAKAQRTMGEAIAIYVLKQVIYVFLVASTLFLIGGTVAWLEAWVYLGMMVLIIIANSVVTEPSLLVERSQLQEGTKRWDILLSSFTALWGPLIVLVIAGLDKRLGWSEPLPTWVTVSALVLLLLGAGLGTWAMHTNCYFSATVRIQHDRNQQVIDSGPYRFVRHPGYIGGIFGHLAVPCLLGSIAGLLASILVVAGIIVRTALEDRLLHSELSGYENYAQRVRYRLFPPIW